MKSKASARCSETCSSSSSTVPTSNSKLRINNWNKQLSRDKHPPHEMINKVHCENNLIAKSSHSTASARACLDQVHQSTTSSFSSSPMTGSLDSSVGDKSQSQDADAASPSTCGWCQKQGIKLFTLRTSEGCKVFCSELCFSQCRRASFKKTKVCNWCKHVRHTVNYVEYFDGKNRLQFCSDKCLDQYKLNIMNGEMNRIPVALLQSLHAATAYANSLAVNSSLSSSSSSSSCSSTSSSASSSPSSLSSSRIVNDILPSNCSPSSTFMPPLLAPISKYHSLACRSPSSPSSSPDSHLPVDLCVKKKSSSPSDQSRSADASLFNSNTARPGKQLHRVIEAINLHHEQSNLMKLLPQTIDVQRYLSHFGKLAEEMRAQHHHNNIGDAVSRMDRRAPMKRPLDYGIEHPLLLNTAAGQVHSNKVKKCKRTINSEEAITAAAAANEIHTLECNRDDNHHNETDEQASLQLGVKRNSSNLLDKVNGNSPANRLKNSTPPDETVAREILQVMKCCTGESEFTQRWSCCNHEKMKSPTSRRTVRVDGASSAHLLFSWQREGCEQRRRQYTRSLADGEEEEEEEEERRGEGENEREEEQQQHEEEEEEEKKEKREEMKVSEVERERKEIGGEVKDEMRGGERSLETQWPARNVKAESSGVQSLHQCKRKDEKYQLKKEEENCEKKKNTDHSNNGNSNDSGAHSGEKRHHQSKSHHSHTLEKRHEQTRNKKQTDRHSLAAHASTSATSEQVTCNFTGHSSSKRLGADEMSKSSFPKHASSSTCLPDSPSPCTSSSSSSQNELSSPSSSSCHPNSCISGNTLSPYKHSSLYPWTSASASASASTSSSSSCTRPVLPAPLILPVPFPVPIPIFLLKPDLICQINEMVARSTSDKNNSLADSDSRDNTQDNASPDTSSNKHNNKINFLPRREHMSRDTSNEENVCR